MGRVIALAAAAVLVLGGCTGAASGTASPAPSFAGGPPSVRGTVTAGPVCPVERNPPDPSCAPRPVSGAVIVATNAAGEEVGRATTAADGTYALFASQTGTITLTPQPVTGLMGTPQPVQVTLNEPGLVKQLDLSYDTGIR